jgi:hypothetical protein
VFLEEKYWFCGLSFLKTRTRLAKKASWFKSQVFVCLEATWLWKLCETVEQVPRQRTLLATPKTCFLPWD